MSSHKTTGVDEPEEETIFNIKMFLIYIKVYMNRRIYCSRGTISVGRHHSFDADAVAAAAGT